MHIKIKDAIYKSYKSGLSSFEIKMKHLQKHPILQLLTFSFVLIFVLEMLSRHSIIKGLGFIITNPLMFLFNVLIILFTLSITMMFSRKSFLLASIIILWLILGAANFVLLSFRTTPLTAMDLFIFTSVIEIIHIYVNTVQIISITVIVCILMVGMILLWMKLKKNKPQFKIPLIVLGVTAILMLMLSNISLKVNVLSTNYGNLADAYSEYGFAYCFSFIPRSKTLLEKQYANPYSE